jgi:Flp pilus assembly pilin Flp
MKTGKFCRWTGLTQAARRLGRRRGNTSVEYALLLGTVTVSSVAMWQHLGESVRSIVTAATQALSGLPH